MSCATNPNLVAHEWRKWRKWRCATTTGCLDRRVVAADAPLPSVEWRTQWRSGGSHDPR
jgi:hypothetical protein